MNFIEISDGICLRKEEIVAILRKSDGGSVVKTANDAYTSHFSYETIKQLLEMGNIEEKLSGTSANSYIPPTPGPWSGSNFEGQHWRG